MDTTASVECTTTSNPEITDGIPCNVHESNFDKGEGTCTMKDLELHLDDTILSTIEMLDEALKRIDTDDHFRYDEMSTEGKSKLLVILNCVGMLIHGANILPNSDPAPLVPMEAVTRSDGMIEGPAICEGDATVSEESDPSISETEKTASDFMPNVPIIIVTRPDETIDFPKMCDDDMVPQQNLKTTSGTSSLETETKADCIITSGEEVRSSTRDAMRYPDCIGTSSNPSKCAADAIKEESSFPSPVMLDMKKCGQLQNSLECASTVGTAAHQFDAENKKEVPLIPFSVVSGEPDQFMQSCDVSYSELHHWPSTNEAQAPVKMETEETTLSNQDAKGVAVDNKDIQAITEPRQSRPEASLPILVQAYPENKSDDLEQFPVKMEAQDTLDVNMSQKLNCDTVSGSPAVDTIDDISQTISETQLGKGLGICVSEDTSGVFPSASEKLVQISNSIQGIIEYSGIPAQRSVKEFAVVTPVPETTNRAMEIPFGTMETNNGSIDFNQSQECQRVSEPNLLIPKTVHPDPSGINGHETLFLEMEKQGIASPDHTLACKGTLHSITLEDISEMAPQRPSALRAKYHSDPVRSVANSKESTTDVLYAVEANMSTALDTPSLEIPNTRRTHSQSKCKVMSSSEFFAPDITEDPRETDSASQVLVITDAQTRSDSQQSIEPSANSTTDFFSAISNNINEAWQTPDHGVKSQKKVNQIFSLGCNGSREPLSSIAPTTDASKIQTLSGDLASYSNSIDNLATIIKTNASDKCLSEREIHNNVGHSSYENSKLPVVLDNINEIAPVGLPQVIMKASSSSDHAVPHSTQDNENEDLYIMLELREGQPWETLKCSGRDTSCLSLSKEAVQNAIEPDEYQTCSGVLSHHQDLFKSSTKYITKASNNDPANKDSIKPAEDFARCNDSAHKGPKAASSISDEMTASQGNSYNKEMKPKISYNYQWKHAGISSFDKFDSASKWNESDPRVPDLLVKKHCSALEESHTNFNSKAGILFGGNSKTPFRHEEKEPVKGRNYTTPPKHSSLQNTGSKLKKLEDEDFNSPQVCSFRIVISSKKSLLGLSFPSQRNLFKIMNQIDLF